MVVTLANALELGDEPMQADGVVHGLDITWRGQEHSRVIDAERIARQAGRRPRTQAAI
ncbi:MAG TPA: hypothetical protein PKD87_08470 [Burkholderiaceae bacterium]|nr:hypothetical protein [Anaerolineae bacterium]HMM51635.1 hypothetical protein [Burkholderiaceae bacterium]